MQQKCSAIYLILFLSIGSWQRERIYANAQAANTSGSSPAPANGVERSIVGSPTPAGSTAGSTQPTPVVPPATTISPAPSSGTIPNTSSNGTIPNTSSGTSGAVPPTPGTVGTGSASSPAPGNTGISTSPGPGMAAAYVMPVPDETAVVVKSRDQCHLALSLFGVLGSKDAGANGTACKNQTLSEYKGNSEDRSSSSIREGVVTTSVGAQFCVSVDGAEAVAAEANRLSFSSTDSLARELPDIYDPACADPDADLRQGCSGPAPTVSSFMDVTSSTDSSNSSTDSSTQGTSAADAASSPDTSTQLADCARKFLRVGRVPRSAAIILLKWDRKYYKSKEDCCTEQGNAPNCDCNWSGYTYDNLPPPKAYSKYFTDECDLGPSINRAYYDLSGGKVTFHSKLRVPSPRGVLLNPTPDSSSSNSSSSGGVSTSSDSSTPPPPAGLDLSTSPSQPIETATSYLDPDGVDVYGWATLTDMRTDSGLCRDWCGDAMQQLNVNGNDYNHIICLQLLASKSLCDVCNGGDCVGTCPASTGITTGCGCATCYYAWGGQASCHRPGDPGTRVGMGANTRTYNGEMAANAGGPLIVASEQLKRFITHEIGHNMGLTHTGSINCKVDGDSSVSRDPQQCKPDWYGDTTSFMGSGGTLVVPNAIRYKVRWLPRYTLRTHPQGAEQTYTLRAATTRRPSWQSKNPPGWFSRNEALTVRVQLRNPPGSKQDVGGYSCPCSAAGKCPTCTSSNPGACDNGPCCLDAACADDGLNTLYIELHQPYRNDYEATNSGVAVRMMGDLTNCTSTRLIPAYASAGQANYLLTKPDPTGVTPGSKYEDLFRGVRVVLESWDKAEAVIRVWSA